MTLTLIEAQTVKIGDMMEDDSRCWYPVLSIYQPPSCMWIWFTLGPQRMRMASRGSLVMVGRDNGKATTDNPAL
jgi:hypothetical protein